MPNPTSRLAVDELVLRYASTSASAEEFFDELAAALDGGRLAEQGPAEFLRALRPGPEADLVASALLRLLGSRPNVFDGSPFRRQLAEFLDDNYANALKQDYSRPKKRSAYEVLNAFAPVVPAVEQRAFERMGALRGLSGIDGYRQALLKLLNSSAGRVVFRPFLPANAIGAPLADFFVAAIDLRDAADEDAMGMAYRRLAQHADAVQRSVDNEPTYYARHVLLAAVEAIRDACKRQLELKSPPARLTFRASGRPLPLLEPGVTCTVEVDVLNEGDAPASEVEIVATAEGVDVAVTGDPPRLPRLDPDTKERVSLSLIVARPSVRAYLDLRSAWTNLDHSIGRATARIDLRAHEVNIDWTQLEVLEPFAPYPVEQPEQLVGRERQLASLRNVFTTRPLANLYVTGQRRVGKTSLVRVLTRELKDVRSLVIASVEMGEARSDEPQTTIGALGRKLAERIATAAGLAGELPVFGFGGSLSPLTDVVDQILEWDESLMFLFVVDEFDELPPQTYRRDGPGDALFVPMRSLAQRPNVGWLLVGGEKMPFIRDEQAARLNTFREVSVDYLSLTDPADERGFGGLVRRPLPDGFSVDDGAVRAIYHESAGNPHFAKEICASLFERSVARRDAVVTASDVTAAVDVAARERDVELFAHFWEDGIFETDERRRRRELLRRDYLSGCADVLRTTGSLETSRVRQAALDRGIEPSEAERLRTEFIRRHILVERGTNRTDTTVPFFRRWLEAEGFYKLPPKGVAESIGEELARDEARLRVSHNEVSRLIRRWEPYKWRGETMTRDMIEKWLEQFDSPEDRRVAFRLLELAHPISEAEIFEGFRRLQRLIAHQTQVRLKPGQKALTHLLVSPLGPSGSSGERFAYTYRQANHISGSNLVPSNRLVDRLLTRTNVTAAVLIDDFIGSGGTAVKTLRPIAERADELIARPPVAWFLFAVAGLQDGIDAIASSADARRLGLRVEVAHQITAASLPLDERSKTVPDANERAEMTHVLRKYGKRAGTRWPLGFGEHAVPIVFPDNCPNNAPGILWADADTWRPLFLRTGR